MKLVAGFPQATDSKPHPAKGGNRDGGSDGSRSGEGAETALEIMIRKRRQAEMPVDLESLGDLAPPENPPPPA